MEREAHQSAFAARLDIRHYEQRLGPQLAILKDAHAPGTFREKHATIRRPNDGPDDFEIRYDRFDLE
jgi:hypothetical protein